MEIFEMYKNLLGNENKSILLERARKLNLVTDETQTYQKGIFSLSTDNDIPNVDYYILKSMRDGMKWTEDIEEMLALSRVNHTMNLVSDNRLWTLSGVKKAFTANKLKLYINTRVAKQQRHSTADLERLLNARNVAKRSCFNSIKTIHSMCKSLSYYKSSENEKIAFETDAQKVPPGHNDLWYIPGGDESLEALGSQKVAGTKEHYEELLDQLQKSCGVNEHNHRHLYHNLHFDVIDMIKAITYSLPLSYYTNPAVVDDCLILLLTSALKFIRKLRTVVYIESNVELRPDEVVYGRILPYLWAQFNDQNTRYRFTCGYNIGEEVRRHAFDLVYKAIHKMMMNISSLYTIISLDYTTIIDDSSDIETTILEFRTQLETLLQQAYVYFVAMVNRDEVIQSFPNKEDMFVAHESHLELLRGFPNIICDIQAVLVLAHSMKVFYDLSVGVTNYEVIAAKNHLGGKTRIYNLRMDQTIYAEPLINNFSVIFSSWRAKAIRVLPRHVAEDYVYVPTVSQIANHFIEEGVRLQSFLMFAKLKITHRKKSFYTPAVVKMRQDAAIKEKWMNRFKKLVLPPQIFSIDSYKLKRAKAEEEETNLRFKWHYVPFWRADIIQAMILNGFVASRTVVELQVTADDTKYFWENNAQVRDSVLEQFALGVIVKDNAVRHKKWRHTNLAKSLQGRRFLECNINNMFKNNQPPPVQQQYLDTIDNLSSRLFWGEVTDISDNVLRILLPVEWWDQILDQTVVFLNDPNRMNTLQYTIDLPHFEEEKIFHPQWIRDDNPMIYGVKKKVLPLGKQ